MKKLIPDLNMLHREILFPRAAMWLPIAIYGVMIIQIMLVWPHRDLLWGAESILLKGTDAGGPLENFMYQLIYYPQRADMILWIHLLCLFPSMLPWRWAFPFRMVSWVTGLMLYYAAYQAFNSGTLLLLLFAFFLIPVTPHAKTPLRKLLNNLSWYGCLAQLMMVYMISAGIKWTGAMWPSGDAVYYAFAIDRFSQPWIFSSIPSLKWLFQLTTWLVLLYQSLFIVFVWFRRWWLHLAISGTILHLAIGLLMNLPVFGLAMIASYLLFADGFGRKPGIR
jgi:hypothetical protein